MIDRSNRLGKGKGSHGKFVPLNMLQMAHTSCFLKHKYSRYPSLYSLVRFKPPQIIQSGAAPVSNTEHLAGRVADFQVRYPKCQDEMGITLTSLLPRWTTPLQHSSITFESRNDSQVGGGEAVEDRQNVKLCADSAYAG